MAVTTTTLELPREGAQWIIEVLYGSASDLAAKGKVTSECSAAIAGLRGCADRIRNALALNKADPVPVELEYSHLAYLAVIADRLTTIADSKEPV